MSNATTAPTHHRVTPATRLCWELARLTRPDDVLIVGVGTPLAATAALLARRVLHPTLTVLFGTAVAPQHIDLAASILDSTAAPRAAVGNYTQVDVLDLVARGDVTLQFVSPVEVDALGNVNASRVRRPDGEWRRFPGSLAIPDTSALVGRLVAYRVGHHKRFFPPRVAFVSGASAVERERSNAAVTAGGAGVTHAVTERATVQLGARPQLIDYEGDLHSMTTEFGFAVDTSTSRLREPVPADVLAAIDALDPLGVRNLEDKDHRSAVLARISARGIAVQ
jgi:acyl CoA:acetate/3-ketoacid CoA transferase beta subunit